MQSIRQSDIRKHGLKNAMTNLDEAHVALRDKPGIIVVSMERYQHLLECEQKQMSEENKDAIL